MAHLVDIDLLLKRFQEELNWNRPPHSGHSYDYDKLRYEVLLEAEEFLQGLREETPEATATQERDAEQVSSMLAVTRPVAEEEDDTDAEDALFDRAQLVSRRDNLDWDRSRGLIYQRAAAELAAEKAAEHLQDSRDEAVETVELQCEKLVILAKALHRAEAERDELASTVETQAEALRWFNLPLSECGNDHQLWYERAQRGQRAVLAAEGRFEDYTPVLYDEAFPGQTPEQLAHRLSDALEALQVAKERVLERPCECTGAGSSFCWMCSLSEFIYGALGEMHRRPESLLDLARRFESERNEAENEARESLRRLRELEEKHEQVLARRNARSRISSWEYLDKERRELLEMLTKSERIVGRARRFAEEALEAPNDLDAAPAWLREDAAAFLDLLKEES